MDLISSQDMTDIEKQTYRGRDESFLCV